MPVDTELMPRRNSARIAGRHAAYLEAGAADHQPVLLLHGFAGDSLTWHFNITVLAKKYRVIAPDLPGHGLSDADVGRGDYAFLMEWLEAFVSALDLDRFHLVGHSMGGCLSVGLAQANSSRVLSLGLLGPAGLSPDFDIRYLEAILALTDEAEAEAMLARMCPSADYSIPMMARAHVAKMRQPAYRQAMGRIAEALLRPAHGNPDRVMTGWQSLPMPLRLIWGSVDHVIPLPADEWLRPHKAIVLPDVGHLPHMEASARVNSELLGLMALASNKG